MAKQTITLAANASSGTITVTWPGMANVESDKPITIKTPSGSAIDFPAGLHKVVGNVVTPEFIITAGPAGASVIVTTADA